MPESILFIMTDQQRFDCLGANGNPLIRTPNLDALALQSANMQAAFAQAPVCVPSRASFFTGRYPHAHRNRVNDTPLKPDEILMPAHLKAHGYATAAVGKLHLHPPTPEEARRRGFDTVYLHDGLHKNEPYSAYTAWRSEHDPHPHIPFKAVADNVLPGCNPYRSAIPDDCHETTWVGMETCRQIERLVRDARPFFLFSSFFKPHAPFEVPAPFDAMYDGVDIPLPRRVNMDDIQRMPEPLRTLVLRGDNPFDMPEEQLEWIYRSYYGAITQIDREVGRILDTLEATGRADETIVVFASDHGDLLLEHGIMGKNVFYESAVRVPLMVRFPGRVVPEPYDNLVETVDLLPTLFELAGLDEPYHCQGRSFARLISTSTGAYEPRDCVFAENIIPEVITAGHMDYRFEKGQGVGGIRHPDAKMVRTQRWKYNHYAGHGGELYDLEADPLEENNLFGNPEFQGIVTEMKARLLDWLITSDETEQIAERWLF